MRKLFFTCVLVCCCALAVRAQGDRESLVVVGAGYDFHFDNLEASGCEINESGTVFGARLKPWVGWEFGGGSRLVFGVDLLQNFGQEVKFVSDAKPFFYYAYKSKSWEANAGVFERSLLQGMYGEHIVKGTCCFTSDLLYGLHAVYRSDKALWEAAVSWDGMHSDERREMFRIFTSGNYSCGGHFHLGYNAKLTHLANSTAEPAEGVVDYIVMAPYAGTTFSAWGEWTLRGHAIVSYQRDRERGDKKLPVGGRLDVALSKWGFTLCNELYVGANQLPFYGRYGKLLYMANENYGTWHRMYNRCALGYKCSLLDGALDLGASFELHCTGGTVALQQLLKLRVNLSKNYKL